MNEKITTKQGLSQNSINCIFQDSEGFMWFGTHDGLNRYDGYDFKEFHFDTENKNGLNSSLINCINQDKFQILH